MRERLSMLAKRLDAWLHGKLSILDYDPKHPRRVWAMRVYKRFHQWCDTQR